MNRSWPDEALAFAAATRDALSRLGGIELARNAERDPSLRERLIAPVMARLGLDELDPGTGPVEAMAAAQAVRAAGAVLCPWPLVARLARPVELRDEVEAVHLVAARTSRLDHIDLFRFAAVDVQTGAAFRVLPDGPLTRMPLDPFGATFRRGQALGEDLAGARRLHELFSAFWILGAIETVASLVFRYAGERRQFGKPIVRFGAIQWRISDIALGVDGFAELATYTLWLATEGRDSAADRAALRYIATDTAETVLVNAHQIFASIGLCEEHDLAVITRHLQSHLRRPLGGEASAAFLADAIRQDGFDGLRPITPTLSRDGRPRSVPSPSAGPVASR